MKKLKTGLKTIFLGTTVVTGLVLVSCGGGKYEIDFDVNGGNSLEKTEYKEGEEFTLPNNLTKEGYTFLGWYDNPEFNGEPITTTTASKNMTFYAKWGKKLSLNLNGASLDTDTIYVAVGENLSKVLANLTPTYGTSKFVGWTLNGTNVKDTDVMPDSDTTVTAVFTQKYKVEYYLNKIGSTTEFESDPVYSTEGEGEVGKSEIVSTDYDNGTLSTSVSQNGTIKISENEKDNVLKLYYQRNSTDVTFHSNYPDESEESVVTSKYEYNQKLSFPSSFSFDGYQIIGWAKSPNGRIVYNDYSLVKNVYGNKSQNNNSKDYYADDVTDLYAVWAKASTDLFGGKDELYLLNDDSSYVYLKRDGFIFEGIYNKEDKSFEFENDEEVILKGKLLDDDKFVYSNISRQDVTFNEFTSAGVNKSTTILFDAYNGIRYSTPNQSGALTSSNGTYSIDENNIYSATFTDGDLNGKTIHFIIGYYNGDIVFQQRNELEYELGDLPVYTYSNGSLDFSNTVVKLNGFGYAVSNSTTYYSSLDGNLLNLYNSNRSLVGSFYLIEYNGNKVLIPYSSTYDVELKNGNKTLKLDGSYLCEYNDGEQTYYGTYTTETCSLGLYIVNVKTDSTDFKFMVSSTSVEVDGESKNVNTFNVINNAYKEFYYQDENTTYYAPLIVIEDETNMTLYGFISKGKFAKVSSGTYIYDKGTYTYTVVGDLADTASDAITSPYDLKAIKSIKFVTDEVSSYSITKWYSYTTEDETYDLTKTYTVKDSNENLFIFANEATYFDGAKSHDASYSVSDDIVTVKYDDVTLYFYLEEDVLTKCELPQTYYEFVNQTANKNTYISKDKYGKLTYNIVDGEEIKSYEGISYSANNFTNEFTAALNEYNNAQKKDNPDYVGFSEDIYEFTYNDENGSHTFIYCLIPLNNGSYYFAKYDETVQGKYNVTADGYSISGLILDGFGYYSFMVTGSERTGYNYFPGLYAFNEEENYIQYSMSSNSSYYFDNYSIEDKTCQFRSFEAGTYIIFDNQNTDYYVVFDGYKNAKVYDLKDGSVVDENATYTRDVFNNKYELTFTDTTKKYVYNGGLYTRTIGSQAYNTFVVINKTASLKFKFVNEEDNSIYDFDELGNANVYAKDGTVETGTYQIITDNLVYYVNSDSTDAYTLVYDGSTVVKSKYSLHGYYTSDFESLVFFQYGFALENGSTRYYYQEIGDDVVMYSYNPKDENANDFGYVQFEFGGYYDEITYNGKTYYSNNGYAINFERKEDNKEKYPLKSTTTNDDGTTTETKYYFDSLTFAPTGQEFSVTGSISYNNKNYSCTVTRALDEEKNPKMTVTIGYIVLDINASFHGMGFGDTEASTYEITGMRYVREYAHASYLSYLQFYYMFTGNANLANTYGSLDMIVEYDENGDVSDAYLNSDFTSSANITDSNGELLNLSHASYEIGSSNMIRASVEGSDNYTYNFYLTVTQISSPKSLYGVNVIVTRIQELETEGYKLKTEQIVSYQGVNDTTKSQYVGYLYGVELYASDSETPIDISSMLKDVNGDLYLISREYEGEDDNKKISATTYYKILVNEKSDVDSVYAKVYDSCSVTKYTATTYYTEDGSSYVDVIDDKLMVVIKDGSFVSYYNPSYDSETETYYYEVLEGEASHKYSVKIVDGKAVITLVEDTTEAE